MPCEERTIVHTQLFALSPQGEGRRGTMLPTDTRTRLSQAGLTGTGASGPDLFGRPRRQRSWLEWWYRLSAPPEAPFGAPIDVRERLRRGRLASTLLLGL